MNDAETFLANLPPRRLRWSGLPVSGHYHTAAAVLSGVGSDLSEFPSADLRIPTSDDTGDVLTAKWLRPRGFSLDQEPQCPLIVLLHGLGGHAGSSYIRRSASWLLENQRDVLLFNFRGAGDSCDLCRKHNHPGRTEDLRDLFRWIERNTEPNVVRCGAVPVGFSLGGNILLKFLAENEQTGPVRAAVTVSAPMDLEETSRRLSRWKNLPYRLYLLHKLRNRVLDETGFLSKKEKQRVRWTKSVWEFDKQFTAPRNGYESVEAYYADNSAIPSLPKIEVPTLLVYARDDPFVPSKTYEEFAWDDHPNLLPAISDAGGHVGFVGSDHDSLWHNRCILYAAENIDTLSATAVGSER
ncbi:YheT family hydrolase [Roseiconus nitratireducens]|uniref:YheT family hydrolase n=1 Tax=Roseiconus nitratireducens TaxID=2605748 RepID=UPI001375D5D3|nr:alpha/beta fold hydrolase [Roseiconus nitratireducens]